MRLVRACVGLVLFSSAAAAGADVFFDVPIVTQVQGVAFYRTSLAVANVGPSSVMGMNFV